LHAKRFGYLRKAGDVTERRKEGTSVSLLGALKGQHSDTLTRQLIVGMLSLKGHNWKQSHAKAPE
jgi:hypothetical protein